jgi:2-polyprenyl-6-methoxyphenol hydroxylase-like FAD-dependent oxidoreductase
VGDAAYCPSPLSGQGNSLALIGAYVLAGELAAAKREYNQAFDEYEKEMRPFVKANQALGIKASKIMKLNEEKNLLAKVSQYLMKIAPGILTKFMINRSTRQINQAANGINLKNY